MSTKSLTPELILDKNNEPFSNKKAAEAAMKSQDLKKANVISIGGGFAIHQETYWRVRFQERQSENEEESVKLACNGETLILRRNTEVIIPGRFREIADHAKKQRWVYVPGHNRKIESPIAVYPYQLIGQATEAEYFESLNRGTELTKEMIERHGFDYDPRVVGPAAGE